MGNRYKQIRPVKINLALHVSFFPSGIGAAEAHPEVIVGEEPGKKFRFVDYVPDSPPYPGGIVKDQQWWNTTNKFKDIQQSLTDAFSRFSSKHLTEAVITVGKGHGKVFFRTSFPHS